jgi:hypothetical protein
MSSSILLDTNGWLMLLNSGDSRHAEADRLWRDIIQAGADVVLTDWIVAETGNGSARSRNRQGFVDAAKAIIRESRVELVVVDEDLLQRSLELYARHADKSWGLVDSASFVVMQDRGITEAFTSDQHFVQAGFACLLAT